MDRRFEFHKRRQLFIRHEAGNVIDTHEQKGDFKEW